MQQQVAAAPQRLKEDRPDPGRGYPGVVDPDERVTLGIMSTVALHLNN
jgi:hypothetical protein